MWTFRIFEVRASKLGLALVRAGHSNDLSKALLVGLSVASIVLAWSVVHTVYSLRYAKLYNACASGRVGGDLDVTPSTAVGTEEQHEYYD